MIPHILPHHIELQLQTVDIRVTSVEKETTLRTHVDTLGLSCAILVIIVATKLSTVQTTPINVLARKTVPIRMNMSILAEHSVANRLTDLVVATVVHSTDLRLCHVMATQPSQIVFSMILIYIVCYMMKLFVKQQMVS